MVHTIEEIRMDGTGIKLQGEHRLLLVSSLFYFRIPRERWRDRMQLLKAAGYHAIDVYFPWNYHQISPDEWCFEENRDVEYFLKLAAENELYVIARPGPYICSEWDGGGIPAWLWEKEVAVRQDDAVFLQEMQSWYGKILPIIAKYQLGMQGTVICMQIENELDFYRCVSPVSYMDKLKRMAEGLEIRVPLFYCCGQNDMLRGGGLTPGLYTAFNVYAAGDNENLEQRVAHLYDSVQERDMPLLVTETNREHGYLKRLLACGAKLISPYNQTAGSTMDYYNGISNWGTDEEPTAFMTSDYDFKSMIGSAGEVNGEFMEARLLSGLIGTLGEDLAKAVPSYDEDVSICSAGKVNTVIPALVMERGMLVAISNLEQARNMKVRMSQNVFEITMRAVETKLLPWKFHVSENCEIRYCNYEVGWIEEVDGQTRVCLYGEGRLECLLVGQTGESLICKEEIDGEYCFVYEGVLFTAGSLHKMASERIPGLTDLRGTMEEHKETYKVTELLAGECELRCTETRKPVQEMEKMGQYRGIGRYRIELQEEGEYLLAGAADLITIHNGGNRRTVFSDGGCMVRKLAKGELCLYTEIWGHSNFDDIRCPGLRMGSLKGINGLIQITAREDITESWMFDLDEEPWGETYFFRHSPYNTIMGIDGYIRAVSPLKTVYTRSVFTQDGEDALFLHFEKAHCMIGVYVNNRYVGMVQKSNSYMDLSKFAGSGNLELTLRIIRRYYNEAAGKVTLLKGSRVLTCMYGEVKPVGAEKKRICTLPMVLKQGENRFLKLIPWEIREKDIKLFFKGKDIKLTISAGGHTAGRILLQEKNMPVMAGGRRDVIHLCKEWCDEIEIWCQATGEEPLLEEIVVEEYGRFV